MVGAMPAGLSYMYTGAASVAGLIQLGEMNAA